MQLTTSVILCTTPIAMNEAGPTAPAVTKFANKDSMYVCSILPVARLLACWKGLPLCHMLIA